MSQKNFQKHIGQLLVFISSTLMEDGGLPEDTNSTTLMKEAIHSISCGYEEKFGRGREVSANSFVSHMSMQVTQMQGIDQALIFKDVEFHRKRPNRTHHQNGAVFALICLLVSDRRYIDWLQDALQMMKIYSLLYAEETCFQGISPNKSIRPAAPSFAMGSWIGGNIP